MEIRRDDLSSAETQALLRLHLAGMHANSPPGHVFALDLSGLKTPDVTVWSAWAGEAILGIGALRRLDAAAGEVKSMRTHPDHVRKGVAAAILERIIAEARAQGLERLSLETGSGPAFEPALRLYRRRGFVNGEAFGDYEGSEFNQFLHLRLT
ncbi:GNAT family N-acetyltransferase [Phenylobacterium soli]|uniref:N-acetyltransferase n=1 Tax=Phenylobacterium soli TaxID=2170551 RepID=A0A328AGQ6_9CAUL|nr:GNAT family N-acetyltransferase [Phenylobacterium soli]RAK53942.1 N-acetyltransferase [Phenylobacterium soli]